MDQSHQMTENSPHKCWKTTRQGGGGRESRNEASVMHVQADAVFITAVSTSDINITL